MRQFIKVIAVALCITACNRNAIPSSTLITNKQIQNERGDTILVGNCSVDILKQHPYNNWYDTNYANYQIDSFRTIMLKPLLANKTIEIFLGSWCGDSKKEVPRMLKILEAAGMDKKNVKLIFVDNSVSTYKQSSEREEKGKNIHHVPTFIFYDKTEIGRIVETPLESLEKDIITILTKTPYTPKYKAIEYCNVNMKNNKVLNDDELIEKAKFIKPLCRNGGELNTYGYVLLAQKNYNQALNIFKLNTLMYKESVSVFDSLGEAYLTIGNNEKALESYNKVLYIDPNNSKAKIIIDKIKNM